MTDSVIVTLGVLITMALLCCFCCIGMKISDMRMKSYILETANRKGIQVDLNRLDPKYACDPPETSEVCTVMIPDVGIVF